MKTIIRIVVTTLLTLATIESIHIFAGLIGSTYERVAISVILSAAISRFLDDTPARKEVER